MSDRRTTINQFTTLRGATNSPCCKRHSIRSSTRQRAVARHDAPPQPTAFRRDRAVRSSRRFVRPASELTGARVKCDGRERGHMWVRVDQPFRQLLHPTSKNDLPPMQPMSGLHVVALAQHRSCPKPSIRSAEPNAPRRNPRTPASRQAISGKPDFDSGSPREGAASRGEAAPRELTQRRCLSGGLGRRSNSQRVRRCQPRRPQEAAHPRASEGGVA
jgi:hypothetical protein